MRHLVGIEVAEQLVRLGPGFPGGVPADDVQPDPESQYPALIRGQVPDPGDLVRHLRWRLSPGQIDIGVPGRDRARGRGRPAEVHVGGRLGWRHDGGALHVVVIAAEIVRCAAPRAAHDGEEFARAGVPLVVCQVVAEPALLIRLAAGHHVEHQPATGDPLIGRGHLGRQCRRGHPRPERDQELQPPRLADQCRGDQPCVLAVRAGGSEHAGEAVALGGLSDLGQVVDVRRPDGGRGGGLGRVRGGGLGRVRGGGLGPVRGGQPVRPERNAVPASHDRTTVAGGGQEPVQLQAHDERTSYEPDEPDEPLDTVSLNVVTM